MTGKLEASAAFAAVSDVLWSERETLERLLYKLVAEQLVVTSGSTRWLNRADAEVRAAVDRLRAVEIVRAAEVDALATAHGLPADTTLERLARTAPEPWPAVLAEHRAALRSLVFEIETVAAENHRLLDAGSTAIRETLEILGLSLPGFDAPDEGGGGLRGPFLMDRRV